MNGNTLHFSVATQYFPHTLKLSSRCPPKASRREGKPINEALNLLLLMDSNAVVLRYMCEGSATVEREKIFSVEYSVLTVTGTGA